MILLSCPIISELIYNLFNITVSLAQLSLPAKTHQIPVEGRLLLHSYDLSLCLCVCPRDKEKSTNLFT